MNAVNEAMEQIQLIRKGFQNELSEKYFSVDHSGSLNFTNQELEYIRSHPTIKIAIASLREPLAYVDNGVYKGIIINVLNEIAKHIGVTFTYKNFDTQPQGIEAVHSQEIDLISHTYTDYNWAETNNLLLSLPYMKLDYISISRIDAEPNNPNIKVAAVKDYQFSNDYVKKHYSESNITWYNNEFDCINAVQQGIQDICFVNSYVSNSYLQDYKYRSLQSSIIGYSHNISIGASAEDSRILLSIIDKAIVSMGKSKINDVVTNYTMLNTRRLNFTELMLRYPLTFSILFGIFSFIIISLIALLIINKTKRKKILKFFGLN